MEVRPMASRGFSMAELLISLMIVGEIAAFSIPKIINSQLTARKKAVFEESIAALNEIFVIGCQRGLITEGNFGTYMRSNLNAVEICSNSITDGCWFGNDLVGQSTTPGVALHNGAVIAGLDDAVGGTGTDTLMIDWDGNGTFGTNTHGDDQLVLKAIINNSSTTDRVCTIRWDTAHTASGTLWQSIFQ